MRIRIIGLLILAWNSLLFGQTEWNNIVPNYSFEETDVDGWLESDLGSTIDGLGDFRFRTCNSCYPDLSVYEQMNLYWSFCSNWELPKRRYNWCGFGLVSEEPVPSADITYEPLTTNDGANNEYQRHFSGNLCAFTGAGGEFVVTKLEENIIKANYYYVEAFIGTDSEVEQDGTVDLFTKKPHVCSTNKYITEYGGNGNHQTILMTKYPFTGTDSLGWTRFKGYFIANDNFNWMSIGSDGDMYWDDLKIINVSDNLCRDEWYFDNTVFNYLKRFFKQVILLKQVLVLIQR